jgi:hypothetical protein
MAASTLNSCTIGIQNATRDTALQVVFDAAYVHSGLAVEIHRPSTGFLAVAPRAGTIAPGQHLDLTIGFNGNGRAPGEYAGVIRLVSSDPIEGVKDVPCRLTLTGILPVQSPPVVTRFGLRFAGGNPSSDGARLELAVPMRGVVSVKVFDVRGAMVNEIARREFDPGLHSIAWDGTDAAGNRSGAGVYFIRAITPAGQFGLRFALLR